MSLDEELVRRIAALEKQVKQMGSSVILPNVDCGSYGFTGMSSGTPKNHAVTFSKAFANAPQVTLGCVSTVPQNVDASVGAVSTTGFTLYGCRADADATLTVYWMAME